MSVYVIEDIIANEISLTGDPMNEESVMLKNKENDLGITKIKEETELEKSEEFEKDLLLKSIKAITDERDALRSQLKKSECVTLAETNFENIMRISKSEGALPDVLLHLKSTSANQYATLFNTLLSIERVLKAKFESLDVPSNTEPVVDDPITEGLKSAIGR